VFEKIDISCLSAPLRLSLIRASVSDDHGVAGE